MMSRVEQVQSSFCAVGGGTLSGSRAWVPADELIALNVPADLQPVRSTQWSGRLSARTSLIYTQLSVAYQNPQIEGRAIVAAGAFQPILVNPYRLLADDLLRKADLDNSEVSINAPDVSKFTLAWGEFLITEERIEVVCGDPTYYGRLRDLLHAIFRLPGARVDVLGLNSLLHFGTPSQESQSEFFSRLAPAENWQFLPEVQVRTIAIQSARSDGYSGYVNIRVEPSVKEQVRHGIFFNVNHHFNLRDQRKTSTSAALKLLSDSWDQTHKDAISYARQLIGDQTADIAS